MIYGFTGTQEGATDAQLQTATSLLLDFGIQIIHHGGCKGADTQMHAIALKYECYIHLHPGPAFNIATDCLGADIVYEPLPNLKRNLVIAKMIDRLIATPKTAREIQRSGTWATIRYARKLKREIWIIKPDGSVSEERGLSDHPTIVGHD